MAQTKAADVSVIIPNYDRVSELSRALESVREQTVHPREVIVVDDASPNITRDDLETVCASAQHDSYTVKLIFQPCNRGPAAARNVGWDAATSKYVAFLDSDDVWHPEKLRIQIAVMEADPSLVMTCHWFSEDPFGESGSSSTSFPDHLESLPLWKWLKGNRASVPAVVVRRSVAARFPDGERFSEDYELWLRMAAGGARTARIPVQLARCFKPVYGHSGLSGQLAPMARGELRAIRRALRGHPAWFVLIPGTLAWSCLKTIRRFAIAWFSKRGLA